MKKLSALLFAGIMAFSCGCNKILEELATESPDVVSFSNGEIPSTWQTATWTVDNTGGYDDIYSLRATYQGTVTTTKTIQGNGYLEFFVKGNVDYFNHNYNKYYDYYNYPCLKLYLDGNIDYYYTVETIGSWKKYIVDLDEGTHTFLWEYNGKQNTDFCNIDAIKFTFNSTNPRFGDYYQGGYVCYLDASRKHGLILSENDLGNYNWENAMSICDNYSVGQYSDWRLPTISEAMDVTSSIEKTRLWLIPEDAHYWTSTESYDHYIGDGYYSFVIWSNYYGDFICGRISTNPNEVHLARAIRSF